LKQEAVYLTEITDGFHAGRVIDGWIAFYNAKRPHSALAKRTPDEACWSNEKGKTAAWSDQPIHLGRAVKLTEKPGPLQGSAVRIRATPSDGNTRAFSEVGIFELEMLAVRKMMGGLVSGEHGLQTA
jgi:hypothetical protein